MTSHAEQAIYHTTDDANTAIVHAILDVADAIREGNAIEVDIAEAINTPGGILDTLAPITTDELRSWAASLPAGPPRSLLVGLLAIKEVGEAS